MQTDVVTPRLITVSKLAGKPIGDAIAGFGQRTILPITPCRYMYRIAILVCMKTTLNIDDALLEEARRLTKLTEKTALVHAGLEALIARESSRRLASLGATEPRLRAIPRRRSKA
jgi:Arc/MetJ family transcription regulator